MRPMFTSPAFIRSLLFALISTGVGTLTAFSMAAHPALAPIAGALAILSGLGLTGVNSTNAAAPSPPAATPPTVAKP
jgi:hypothetical protein